MMHSVVNDVSAVSGMRKQVHLFFFNLRCYVVRSKLRGHQVSLVDFGKAKVTQLHRCILQNRQNHRMRDTNMF